MKSKKLLLAFIFLNLYITSQIKAGVKFSKHNTFSLSSFSPITDDPNLTLTVIQNGADINIHVSFAGNEGNSGTIKIFNSSNQLITQLNIALKNLPLFDTINLNEYSSGTYTIELTTPSGVHTSHITIQ